MPDPVNFDALMCDLGKFEQVMTEAQSTVSNARDRGMLSDLLTCMQDARAQVIETYPQAVSAIKASAEKSEAEIKAGMDAIDKRKKELEELLAARKDALPPSPPAKPEMKIDPALGQNLREELLGRYGKPEGPNGTAARRRIREAWEDWD